MGPLPEKFLDRMQQRLGETYPAFLASYERPPLKGLRVNTLKISAEEFARIAPFPLGERVGQCDGYYIEEERAGADPYHFAGLCYLQEPSAMTVGTLAVFRRAERVLDLCAAPGGKTTHIAQIMGGKGVLISNEIDYKRAKILLENVERMGIANCAVTNATPEMLAQKFRAYFDLILVDAPCSGEGMFKREPNAIPEWSGENVAMCAARQKKILNYAAEMLCEGGSIVYSTCTFAEEEDEWQVRDFLREHPDFSLSEERKLYPHEFKGEGHFMAVLERPTPLPPSTGGGMTDEFSTGGGMTDEISTGGGEGSPLGGRASAVISCPPPASGGGVGEGVRPKPFRVRRDGAAEKAFSAFCKDFFADGGAPAGALHTLADGRMYLVPDGMPDFTGVPLMRLGVQLGEWDGKLFKPAHALAVAFGSTAKRKISLGREESRAYLRGETFVCDMDDGWVVVCVDGFPLGLGKAVHGVVKNHYPKGLRLRT